MEILRKLQPDASPSQLPPGLGPVRVRVVEGKEVHPAPHPVPHFVVNSGLLYCVAQRRGEEKILLVVPQPKTETVMELAHSHSMAGHLGAQNTIQRIRDRFHWPGLDAEVRRFCQACPTCQRTSPQTPPPRSLIPLPIIEVSFQGIGMDLPSRHPHRDTDRPGDPVHVPADGGSLSAPQGKTAANDVYHPQTDGLVERFNKTLKQMLRRVAAEDKRDWDQMLPYVLYGIREVPQASTGFTPFKLLFGRQPRGLLDVAREAWEHSRPNNASTTGQPNHGSFSRRPCTAARTEFGLQVSSYMAGAIYSDRESGSSHLPCSPARPSPSRAAVNLLKKWVGNRTQLAALASSSPVVVDIDPQLSAAQKTELQHLVGQFSDVFSPRPGQTNIIQHDIRTPPGVIIQQRPYCVPEARRHAVEEEIKEMLKLGVIEPSRSPWSSPIIVVPKPDGTLRFCNDFRRLNEISEFDGYPMPPGGHWQYRTLPFGLHGAPATFQRMMDIILRPHQTYAVVGGPFSAIAEGAGGAPAGWTYSQPPEVSSRSRSPDRLDQEGTAGENTLGPGRRGGIPTHQEGTHGRNLCLGPPTLTVPSFYRLMPRILDWEPSCPRSWTVRNIQLSTLAES
ncbi:hypothetical protein QQF64_009535 [Cirrhinus molitorella]|uniref:Gypsy retrotransposon integrase-like protein 1 n=1 Tax=Cirrhinus molitorella TaxID=172907 RepID=A0ABR3M1H6_9TELE